MPSLEIVRCGLLVEAAEEAVKCMDERFMVIRDLQSAFDLQGGSHTLQVMQEWPLSCVSDVLAGDCQMGSACGGS